MNKIARLRAVSSLDRPYAINTLLIIVGTKMPRLRREIIVRTEDERRPQDYRRVDHAEALTYQLSCCSTYRCIQPTPNHCAGGSPWACLLRPPGAIEQDIRYTN